MLTISEKIPAQNHLPMMPPARGARPLLDIIQTGDMAISVDLARRILAEANYERQRKIYRDHVAVARLHMDRGTWVNGHQIWFVRLPDRLYLIDGQHRLTALIEANRDDLVFSVRIQVGRTIEDVQSLYHRTDRFGRDRSTAEMLNSAGVAVRAGVSKGMLISAFKAAPVIADKFSSRLYRGVASPLPLDDDKIEFLESWWPIIRQYEGLIKDARVPLKRGLTSVGAMSVAMFTLRHQPVKAAEFWHGLAQDDGLRRGDPRKTLGDALAERHVFESKWEKSARGCALAWNAFYRGKQLTVLRVNAGDAINIDGTGVRSQ